MKGDYEDWREEEFVDEEEFLRNQQTPGTGLARLNIGTSGWSYKDWEGPFYPAGTRPADYLRLYGQVFHTVEVDSTFYAVPRETVVENWARRSPDGFRFAAKFPRDVTHEKEGLSRLDIAHEFVERMSLLGNKLGPLLLQFSPYFGVDHLPALTRFLDALPKRFRYAVEFRDADWHVDEVLAMLRERDVAWVAGVGPHNPPVRPVTADFAYLRWIGDREIEVFDQVRVDRREELGNWVEWIEEQREQQLEIYGYFNNHYAGHGPASARGLLTALGQRPPDPPPPPAPPEPDQGDLFGSG